MGNKVPKRMRKGIAKRNQEKARLAKKAAVKAQPAKVEVKKK
jgi:hypothetical protein